MPGDVYGPPSSREAARLRFAAESAEREQRWQAAAGYHALKQVPALARRAEHGDVPAMQQIAKLLTQVANVRHVIEPANAVPRFQWARRPDPGQPIGTIFSRAIVDFATFAEFVHEVGHAINGPCPNTGAHFKTRVDDCTYCLQCESEAWQTPQRLVPFSDGMFRRLRECLQSYRDDAPGTPDAIAALDQTASRLGRLQAKQKYVGLADRLERQARIEAEIEADKRRYV
jgi:hypothetical protein